MSFLKSKYFYVKIIEIGEALCHECVTERQMDLLANFNIIMDLEKIHNN